MTKLTFPKKHKIAVGDKWIIYGSCFTLDEIKVVYPTSHYYWTETTAKKYDAFGKYIKAR